MPKKSSFSTPEAYALYLNKQRERCQRQRDEKKRRWQEEPHTRAMVEQRDREHERILNRDRSRRHYSKNKIGVATRREPSTPETRTRLRDMTPVEFKAHHASLRKARTARLSHQKKTALKKKNRERMQEVRAREKAAVEQEHGLKLSVASLTSRLPKSIRNFAAEIKRKLKKKTASPAIYGELMARMANPRTPEKKAAVGQALSRTKAIKCLFAAPAPVGRKSAVNIAKRRNVRRRSRRNFNAQSEGIFMVFYMHSDVSRVLPHKRYATKHGAGYVMMMTIKSAHALFQAETGETVSMSWFAAQRPRNIKKMGAVPVETCLCVCCTNVKLKMNVLRRVTKSDLMPSETGVMDFVLCPKRGRDKWHKIDCISGTCRKCSDRLRPFYVLCRESIEAPVAWTHWERQPNERGQVKLDVVAKNGDVMDCLEGLERDLEAPVRGTSFFQHLFTAFWQFSQFRLLKSTLREGQVMLIMDFAENRKAMFSAEVKSAHFGKGQVILHPIVAFFKDGDILRRQALMFLTDDLVHDYHAVHHFTTEAIRHLRTVTQVQEIVIWSDGCASQYKGKGTFADLSLMAESAQRCYFGSEHGKGEADGETGVLSQAMAREQRAGRNFRHARDRFLWAKESMAL